LTHRKAPASLKAYINGLREVKGVVQWIRKEIMDEQSRHHIKWMSALSIIVILCQALSPAAIGSILTGVSSHVYNKVVLGVIGTALCLITQKVLERKMNKHREQMLFIHWGNMDKRMTELFFEKSPGQHIQETRLSPSGIEKGRWGLLAIQGLIFFEALPTLNQIAISLTLLILISVIAGGWMVSAVCCYVAWSLYMNYNVMKVCTPIDKSMRKLNRRRTERMEKVTRVVTTSQAEREVEEMTVWFTRETTKECKFWFWFIDKSSWRSLMNIAMFLAVLLYGVKLAWLGVWKVGMLYPLYSWSTRICENLWVLADIEHKINWNLPSIVHMIDALSIPPDVVDSPNAVNLLGIPQTIEVEEVSHSYPPDNSNLDLENNDDPDEPEKKNEEEVPHTLKRVSFTIEPGEKVALLGPSGAGKTTIMNLLLRFMDPTEGRVTVGGVSLKNIKLNSWRKWIGYIAQHPQVFDGTVRDNLTYRLSPSERARITDEELWALMRELEIDFGSRLDKGLYTRVGKHGLKLSGGQAQRLMIGAAVIGNPWFMVIDEATSSLDSTTERKVQNGLEKILSGNRSALISALIVAHRLSTVRHLCTKYVILKPACAVKNGDSQVEAIGRSFEDLYDCSPTFRQMADDQGIKIERTANV
jgi:ABC-type multidrug transport system fused ATPase/permease subunit